MPESEEELLRRDRELFTLVNSHKELEAENARLLKAMDEFRRVAQYDRDDARRAHEQIDALHAEIEDLRLKVPSEGVIPTPVGRARSATPCASRSPPCVARSACLLSA